EMLFDGDIFRWQRLDNLISSAASGSQLDLEGLLDQVLDFLFSPKAGLLRNQLVEAAVDQLDALGWQTAVRLSQRLPRALRPPGLRDRVAITASDVELLSLEPIQRLVAILNQLPGFDPQLLLKRVPRLLQETELRRMGTEMAKGLAERSMVRLVRDVLVSPA
ncbi:MAG: AarF/ABC1/UbiB kinase family protein, partial [Vulcanococcus sp.]